jgi:ubiquinol-cytochrome c reductase cytochrome b subunit
VAGVLLYGLLWAAAANDQIAYHVHLDLYTVTWMFRVPVLAGPALAFGLTRVICHAQADRRHDEERHGHQTGRIVMNPHGGYDEIREPARRAAPPGADPPGPATARQIGEGGRTPWTGRARSLPSCPSRP